MAKKKKVSKKKIFRFCLILILIGIIIVGGYYILNQKGTKKKTTKEVKVEEKIEDYGYELSDNETPYYKSLFKNLKGILSEKEVDEEKYASIVGQLFLADFFNLDNKLSRNDIGGLQFVYTDFRADFEKLAKDTVYHYVESDVYDDRKQKLPVVKEVSVVNIETTPVTYLDQTDENAYQIDLKITYEEDMGYQESAKLILVHYDNRLEIIKMTEE